MQRLPLLTEIQAERARRSLEDFIKLAWPIVEPGTPLLWNWHIGAIASHLQAVSEGHIRRLVINIPPGHMKSLITSVFWPAWEWIDAPDTRSIFTSYALDLARRDSMRCRDIVTSDWYKEAFDPRWTITDGHWRLKGDQNAKDYYENSKKGFRFCTSVGSRATGFRGKKVVCDDPLNAKEMHSKTARDECVFWWDKVMPTRINDPRSGAFVLIMQRLHEEDLTGHLLERGGYEHLCLPSEYDPKRKSITFVLSPMAPHSPRDKADAASKTRDKADAVREAGQAGVPTGFVRLPFWKDPREVEGELLHPELFTPEVLDGLKKQLGSADYAGQHGQQPSPDEGMILKRHWWRYWCHAGQKLPPVRIKLPNGEIIEREAEPLPETFDQQLQSWDMTFKDTKGSDFVAGQVWARKGANKFLMHRVLARMDFPATLDAVRQMGRDYPRAHAKLVEDKANGPAVISMLQGEISGLIAVEPEGGKEARAHAVSPGIESGNVYVPHPLVYGWVDKFLDTCTAFPNVANDDDVDAATQALARFQKPPEKATYKPAYTVIKAKR